MITKDVLLDELVTISGGGTPSTSKPEYFTGTIPWVSPKDMKFWEIVTSQDKITEEAIANSTAKLIDPGAVLVVIRSGVLKHSLPVAINRVPVTINQDVKALRCGKRILPEFLARYLQANAQNILTNVRGTTADNIPTESLRQLRLPLPPLAEQKRIAEILDRAEALRAKRRAALALLDELTQSIFLDMFGDPVTNPKGWELKTLGASLTFQLYGPRFYNEKYSDEGIPIVRITDLDSQGNLDFNSMPRLVVSDEDREKYRLQAGDILFARTGATVGKVALIQSNDPECIAGAYFIVMRFSSALDPRFVRSVLTSRSIQQIVWIRSQQSAQQNFSGPGLRSLPMPHPPTKLQKVYADRVATLESIKEPHRRSLAELDQLFASLQHRAFSAQL